jgi:hypothetical protein
MTDSQYETAPTDTYTVFLDFSPYHRGGHLGGWNWNVKHPMHGVIGSGIEHMAKRWAQQQAVKPVPAGALYRIVTNHRQYGPLERKPATELAQ